MKQILKEQHYLIKNHIQKGNAFPAPLFIKLSQMNGCSKYFCKNSKYIKF